MATDTWPALRTTDLVRPVTAGGRVGASHSVPRPRERFTVIPNGLDLSLYAPPEGPRDGSLTLLSVGQLASYKGHVHLLDAQNAVVAQVDVEPISHDHLHPARAWRQGEFLDGAYNVPLPPTLPPGTYHLDSPLYVRKSGVTLWGDGAATILQHGSHVGLQLGTGTGTLDGLEVRGLTFTGLPGQYRADGNGAGHVVQCEWDDDA